MAWRWRSGGGVVAVAAVSLEVRWRGCGAAVLVFVVGIVAAVWRVTDGVSVAAAGWRWRWRWRGDVIPAWPRCVEGGLCRGGHCLAQRVPVQRPTEPHISPGHLPHTCTHTHTRARAAGTRMLAHRHRNKHRSGRQPQGTPTGNTMPPRGPRCWQGGARW